MSSEACVIEGMGPAQHVKHCACGSYDHMVPVTMSRGDIIHVDRCIAPIVRALHMCHVTTLASCCGHGVRPGHILLQNGRQVWITWNREQAERISALFGPCNPPPAPPEKGGE